MMQVLDLFSGIGAFSLGLEATGGFRTAAFCEIEPFPRAVLRTHWPEVPQYDDVRTLTAARLRADGISVDVICGGFPCQDISAAGKGAGLSGERSGLWFEYARLIGEIRPAWVIIENVPPLRSRGLDVVLGCLAALGYDAEWHCIPASAIGAPHRRDRVWIVAYSAPGGRREHGHERGTAGDAGAGQSAYCREALANSSSAGLAGTEQPGWREPVITAADVRRSASERRWGRSAPGLDGKADRTSGGVDRTRPVEAWEGNTPRTVGRRYPNRRPRLKAIGNSIVPQIAELIGRAILNSEGVLTP